MHSLKDSLTPVLFTGALAVGVGAAALQAGTPAGRVDPAQAMTILKANCFNCHNEEKTKADLKLTSREALLKGGESGPALVPGKSAESLLVKVILPDADPHMPPKKQLSEPQIATLRGWIDGGAAWDTAALADQPAVSAPIELGSLPGTYQPVLALALAPDEKRLAVGRGNQVIVFDVSRTNHPVLATLEGHRDAVQSLAWDSDGRRLAAGGFQRILLWDAATLKEQSALTNGLAGRVTALAFAPDRATLFAADGVPGQTNHIRALQLPSLQPTASWSAHADTIFDLKASRNGKWLATAGADKLLKLWDVQTRREIARFEGHTGYVLALAFSPDDQRLASASADKSIKVWDLATREQTITLGGKAGGVTALVWTGDGDHLVAVSEDGAPKVYTELKAHSGGEQSRGGKEKGLSEVNEMLYCVAASTDAKRVFAGCHDGRVYVWGPDGKVAARLGEPAAGAMAAQAARKD